MGAAATGADVTGLVHHSDRGVQYVDWFNHRRLHGEIGHIPPLNTRAQHYRQNTVLIETKANQPSLQ